MQFKNTRERERSGPSTFKADEKEGQSTEGLFHFVIALTGNTVYANGIFNVKIQISERMFIMQASQCLVKTKGADAVLLIVVVLTDLEISYMLQICKKLGLAALC